MVDWAIVAENLSELIRDETGISIKPEEIGFKERKETAITLFDEPLMKIASMEFEDRDEWDTAYIIYESMDRPVNQITDARIAYLTKKIEPIFKQLLKEAQGRTKKRQNYSFRLENVGYFGRSRHYTNERETEWDYPDIFLVIEEFDDFEVEVDPYQVDEPLDKSELLDKLVKR